MIRTAIAISIYWVVLVINFLSLGLWDSGKILFPFVQSVLWIILLLKKYNKDLLCWSNFYCAQKIFQNIFNNTQTSYTLI